MEGLGRSFFEVWKVVSIFIHCLKYFKDSVESQPWKVQQQQRPENIYLQHLEIATNDSQCKSSCCASPDSLLTQRAHERFVISSVLTNLYEARTIIVNCNLFEWAPEAIQLLFVTRIHPYFWANTPWCEIIYCDSQEVEGDKICDNIWENVSWGDCVGDYDGESDCPSEV